MDTTTKMLGVTLLLMLAVFPLTAIGTDRDVPALWWTGLAVLAVASAIPPALRFVIDDAGDAADEDDDPTAAHADEEDAR
jgi:hypothetical protein